MTNILWPIRTGETFFDEWSLVHFAFWFVIGANLAALKAPPWLCWTVFIVGALAWEIVEKFVVDGMLGWVAHPERWFNSWISDILVAPIGGFAGYYLIKHGGGL